jgi:hypothetical protein
VSLAEGATILRIGGTDDDVKIEGGGLLIDYKTVGDRITRLILGFNENGMWVEYDSLAQVWANFQDNGPQDAR